MKRIKAVCFHRVSDEHSPAYPPMPVKVFKKIIRFIDRRYGFISLDEVGLKDGVLLTFDDAYFDFYENVKDFLKQENVPVTLNIVAHCAESGETIWTQKLNDLVEAIFKQKKQKRLFGLFSDLNLEAEENIEKVALKIYLSLLTKSYEYIDDILLSLEGLIDFVPNYTRMMRWSDFDELNEVNVSFGSHTYYHKNLEILKPSELNFELVESRNLLSDKLKVKIKTIAFPNGKYNRNVLEQSQKTGYDYFQLISSKRFLRAENPHSKEIYRLNLYGSSFVKNWLKINLFFI